MKTLKRNDINKCFDKINENVGVNRAPVLTLPSGQARDSGRDTFEKENLIKCKIKELNGRRRGFGSDSPTRLGRAQGSPQLQPSSEGSRGEVPKDGKADPGVGNHIQKTLTLLTGSYRQSPNRISDEANTA